MIVALFGRSLRSNQGHVEDWIQHAISVQTMIRKYLVVGVLTDNEKYQIIPEVYRGKSLACEHGSEKSFPFRLVVNQSDSL